MRMQRLLVICVAAMSVGEFFRGGRERDPRVKLDRSVCPIQHMNGQRCLWY